VCVGAPTNLHESKEVKYIVFPSGNSHVKMQFLSLLFQHFITPLNPLFSPFGVEFNGKGEYKNQVMCRMQGCTARFGVANEEGSVQVDCNGINRLVYFGQVCFLRN
jgi:hypothetical protein